MDNQHQKIKGYRDLTQAEIDLMNEIKAHAVATEALVEKIGAHVNAQFEGVTGENRHAPGASDEAERLNNATPARWLSMAKSSLQVGFMEMVRAVAQPSSF